MPKDHPEFQFEFGPLRMYATGVLAVSVAGIAVVCLVFAWCWARAG